MNTLDSPRPLSASCPSREVLRAFVIGKLSEHDLDTVAAHLEQCTKCTSSLLTLSQVGDSLVDSLRRAQPRLPGAGATLAWTVDPASVREGSTQVDGTPAPRPPEKPPERVGRYVVVRRLGHGGFGTVYLARDEELDRLVAVKVPHADRLASSEALEAYHAEGRAHAALDHPHIVPIYDVGRTAEAPFYLVSKFIEGRDLATQLKQAPPDARSAAELVATIAEAVDYMHHRGLVHRDLKPRNIMLDTQGRPHVMDFGLARRQALEQAENPERHLIGTPAYMAPEQARGETAGPLSDVYALGVILYELLTGQRPFGGELRQLLQRIRHTSPQRPRTLNSRVPRDLELICLKAIAKDPALRYPGALALAADLRSFLRGEPPRHARHIGVVERGWAWSRRNAATLLFGAVAAAAVVSAAYSLFRVPAASRTSDKASLQVTVDTDPPEAEIHYIPLHDLTGLPRPHAMTRSKSGVPVALLPGSYLVVAALSDGRFHEVLRTVPATPEVKPGACRIRFYENRNGTVCLHKIEMPPAGVHEGMCLFPGGEDFVVGSEEISTAPPHRCRVPPFYLDPTEASVAAVRSVHPTFFVTTADSVPPDPYPVRNVTWDDAAGLAERLGKRLPEEVEYEFAATNGGQRRFPWGDDVSVLAGWPLDVAGRPELDRLDVPGQPSVFGLYSNVAEWTNSWYRLYPASPTIDYRPDRRVVRGGPPSAIRGEPILAEALRGPRQRTMLVYPARETGLGFRCARSPRPRIHPDDFVCTADD